MADQYTWTDNPTQSGVALCNTDVLNDCLMHLKYNNKYNNKSGGGLELCDIGTALFVDESKGLRRYLNGQIVDINVNTQAWLNRLLAIQTTNPEYFTTETNWQNEATLNVDGCVYKYVLNYDSTGTNVVSVRLPKYPEYVEIDILNTTILPVVGNGYTLGLTDGSRYGGLYGQTSPASQGNLASVMEIYGTNVNTSSSSANTLINSLGITTDPSKSGLVADMSSQKQTKLKLRYFTQIATGQETENNIVNDIELNNPYVLFDNKYVEAPLYNLSWLKSDGEYKPKATYTKAYEALVVEQNSSIAVGTTVDLPSGTKYTKRGLSVKLSTASDITDYDFVINTTDETFRLPLKNGQEGVFASGVKGNGFGIHLTNGSQQGDLIGLGGSTNIAYNANGVNASIGTSYTTGTRSLFDNLKTIGVTTDSSKSGLVVDTTVPSNYSLYYYVGETVQNANLIDAGRIGENLANKLDTPPRYPVEISDKSLMPSWYVVYNDGWCEQGGIGASGIGDKVVTLLKPYLDTNFSVLTQARSGSSNYGAYYSSIQNTKTTTANFTLSVGSNFDGGFTWFTSGYIK